eukprot:Protomagalhaensia_wolfi_Nauph_80__2119@NODE_2360_length_1115_cov_12_396840_g1849_i0_p1_GENE_NODE_2360_length_1115_cov_12_396840_g1849_i0NODE_2360_length_1115_cov_12_396840_g1849_i0_p1_ORF_typecomplete_len346_score44_02_NODE_2360_length_1115_cov_12_396840_g1849_i031040
MRIIVGQPSFGVGERLLILVAAPALTVTLEKCQTLTNAAITAEGHSDPASALVEIGEYLWTKSKPFPSVSMETRKGFVSFLERIESQDEDMTTSVKGQITKALLRELRGRSEFDLLMYHFWAKFDDSNFNALRNNLAKCRSLLFGEDWKIWLESSHEYERLVDSATLVFLLQARFGFPGEGFLPYLMVEHLKLKGESIQASSPAASSAFSKTCRQWWNQIFEEAKYAKWCCHRVVRNLHRQFGRPIRRFKSTLTPKVIENIQPHTKEGHLCRLMILKDNQVPPHWRFCVHLITQWVTCHAFPPGSETELFNIHPRLFTACQLFMKTQAKDFLKPHLQAIMADLIA